MQGLLDKSCMISSLNCWTGLISCHAKTCNFNSKMSERSCLQLKNFNVFDDYKKMCKGFDLRLIMSVFVRTSLLDIRTKYQTNRRVHHQHFFLHLCSFIMTLITQYMSVNITRRNWMLIFLRNDSLSAVCQLLAGKTCNLYIT